MDDPRLIIFARYPEPGKAKTRLIPALGAEGAAEVYRRLLIHTVTVARDSGLGVELRVTGAPPDAFAELLGRGLTISDQGEGDLGARLARVSPPALVIGSDAPGLTAQHLRDASDRLADHDVVIGPAHDGGYYLIGFRIPIRFAFAEMPWSTPGLMAKTKERLAGRKIEPAMLPALGDVDTAEDLSQWPQFRP